MAIVSLSLISCGKHNYSKDDIYTSSNTSNHTSNSIDNNTPINFRDNWSTLDIKLNHNDNKLLFKEIKEWLGTPYKYAGCERGVGADCSGFVMMVYLKVYNKPIERNSARIFQKNCREIKRGELSQGDLVFFRGDKSQKITHVGIYLKEGYFAHASSSKGVVISSLNQNYYNTHFLCAGRVR